MFVRSSAARARLVIIVGGPPGPPWLGWDVWQQVEVGLASNVDPGNVQVKIHKFGSLDVMTSKFTSSLLELVKRAPANSSPQ